MRACIESAVVLVLLAWLACATSSEGSVGGGIRVLYAGAGNRAPTLFLQDPFFESATFIPASDYIYDRDRIRRAIRVYMPRNYKSLIEKYDVISLILAENYAFEVGHQQWFTDAVLNDGKGLIIAGWNAAITSNLVEWTHSSVGETLPIENPQPRVFEPCRIRVLKPENPLMASVPWSTMGIGGVDFAGYTQSAVKGGSEVLAELVPSSGQAAPFLVWWDVGEGLSLAWLPVYAAVERTTKDPFRTWEYRNDFTVNSHLFVARQGIPQDVELTHRIRVILWDCHIARDDLIAMVGFISMVGGDTMRLDRALTDANEQLREIDWAYVNYEFEESLALAEGLAEDLGEAYILGIKVKDRTFFWIYLAEWSVLAATSIVCGVVVWSLMVKRRLYREVEATRLRRTVQPGQGSV